MMVSSGQQSLSTFYASVKFRDPLKACLLSEDIVAVALNSLALDWVSGQEAANRLRAKSFDLPELLRRVLEKALRELGYE